MAEEAPGSSSTEAPAAADQEAEPRPAADDVLAQSTSLVPAQPDESQRKRVAEASVQAAEAQARVAEADARTAEAKVKLADIENKRAETASTQAEDDRKMRKALADKVFKAVVWQVIIADVVFVTYAIADGVQAGTMNAWLGATVVQVIAVALVIARSLFPSK
ncbi:MAG TPA: hypothetical protein VN238_20500 [Solirubrobacteraceae bacterium]|nr:hypothetical protein [Solirubrobacteraceae bacterium]